jgi:hypothetical protein
VAPSWPEAWETLPEIDARLPLWPRRILLKVHLKPWDPNSIPQELVLGSPKSDSGWEA